MTSAYPESSGCFANTEYREPSGPNLTSGRSKLLNTEHRFYYAEKLHKMGEMDDATFKPLQEEVKRKNKEALEAIKRGDISIN